MIKIFPPVYFQSSDNQDKAEKTERNKISYWLGKLYKQEKNKAQDEKNNQQREVNTLEEKSLPSVKDMFHKTDKFLKKEGIDEQTKNQAIKKEADRQTVNDLIKMSNRRIFSISTQFPFVFFPNTIDIEENRVTFTFRQFFSSQAHSVDIKDISNVFIESSLFSASLQVVSHTYIKNNIKIRYLNRKKAEQARKIIEGLRTFEEYKINTSNYEVSELLAKIEEFHIK